MRTKPTRAVRMYYRWKAQLDRVGDKQLDKENRRIGKLYYDGKISRVTRECMHRTAKERLAYMAGATAPGADHVNH